MSIKVKQGELQKLNSDIKVEKRSLKILKVIFQKIFLIS